MTIIIAPSPQAVNWFTFVVLLSKTALGMQGFGPVCLSIPQVLRLRPVVECCALKLSRTSSLIGSWRNWFARPSRLRCAPTLPNSPWRAWPDRRPQRNTKRGPLRRAFSFRALARPLRGEAIGHQVIHASKPIMPASRALYIRLCAVSKTRKFFNDFNSIGGRRGFEPTVRFPAHTLSKRAP
jgi:hypothetical protein